MVKKNFFTTNQADLIINGAGVPNTVSPAFCSFRADEIIEIYAHMSAMVTEGNGLYNKYVLSIVDEDGNVVAVAAADDMEEPSSLSVLYRGKLNFARPNEEYSVQITSSTDAVIPAKALQIAAKFITNQDVLTDEIP